MNTQGEVIGEKLVIKMYIYTCEHSGCDSTRSLLCIYKMFALGKHHHHGKWPYWAMRFPYLNPVLLSWTLYSSIIALPSRAIWEAFCFAFMDQHFRSMRSFSFPSHLSHTQVLSSLGKHLLLKPCLSIHFFFFASLRDFTSTSLGFICSVIVSFRWKHSNLQGSSFNRMVNNSK